MSDVKKLSQDVESTIADGGSCADGSRPVAAKVVAPEARPALQDRAIAVVDHASAERIYPFTTF